MSDHTRKVYLEAVPLDQARQLWDQVLGSLDVTDPETVPVEDALGRVTAASSPARISSPHYHAAAMDGYAVRAAATAGASETSPIRLEVSDQAIPVNTGEPLPGGMDAVIKVEDLAEAAGEIEITAAVVPWSNIRVVGEDIAQSELAAPAGQRLRPVDLGALLAAGATEVQVRRRPKLAVIPTGDELVEPGSPLRPGNIVEFNSRMIAAQLAEWGAQGIRLPPAPDDPRRLEQALRRGLTEAEGVLVIAGASAGTRDFTAATIERMGRLLVHGVAIRPGKPIALGMIEGKPVVGVPGYPVSAMLCLELFVLPLVCRWLGVAAPEREVRRAVLTRKLASQAGSEEFVRVRLGVVGDRLVAIPMARGAGLVSTLARADGWLRVPASLEGFPEGEAAPVELLRPWPEIERALLVVGSHDPALDLLDSYLRQAATGDRQAAAGGQPHPRPSGTPSPLTERGQGERFEIQRSFASGSPHPAARIPEPVPLPFSLTSAHVGSLAGLRALQSGYCHLAGSHLLDEESGEYNLPWLRRLFGPGAAELAAVTLADRCQGLMVLPGNPKGISGWADLAGEGVEFINRQPGAGTRLLLDHHLRREGIGPERISGYSRQLFTHLAVAAAVAGGSADVGLGVMAAARAFSLDFIPLAEERYELVCRRKLLDDPRMVRVLDTLKSHSFRQELAGLGGYRTDRAGEVRYP